MAFREFFEADYRWRPREDASALTGLEHLHINAVENNIIITSVLIGNSNNGPLGLNYTIICSADWAVRSFKIENTNGTSLSMNADGEGKWFNDTFNREQDFNGAVAINFSGTPFTKSLPIHAMKSHIAGASQRFKILHVPFGTLKPKLISQQFTCLVPYKKYRCETRGINLASELEVDANGVVVNDPARFICEPLEN